ncbi:DUF6457 domain-containing protein [Brachybacterium hainanense]|uniref:DUF6457 domain-containing protein n=1 Tax=Brachybacterium hainanense TaxID=1541174 RepID=A0ABV6RGF0_9MICO
MAAARPPVTQQEDWERVLRPWLEEVAGSLGIGDVDLDVDRVHTMTGAVATGLQRSMAPISSFLVGAAVARGMRLEDACRAVERLCPEAGAGAPGGR